MQRQQRHQLELPRRTKFALLRNAPATRIVLGHSYWIGDFMLIAIGLCFAAVAIVLGLMFWSSNGWTSRGRDRQDQAGLRAAKQMEDPTTSKRGAGIN